MDHESAAERARAFVEENQDLVEDPETGEHVLAAIINQGADIATALGEEYEAAAEDAVEAANKLRDAQEAANRGEITPRMLGEAERPHRLRKARYDETGAELNRFMAFVEKTQERFRAKVQEDDRYGFDGLTVPEERLPEGRWASTSKDIPSNAYRPSLWRRWFA